MFTLNNVIILRKTDLIKFFDLEEFWTKKNDFFEVVNGRTIDVFFDTDKEKDCFLLFNNWNAMKGNVMAEIKNDVLYARIGNEDKQYPLGRIASAYHATSNNISLKDRMGFTLLYLMLGADASNSNIEVYYDFLHSSGETNDGLPIGEFVVIHENLEIKHVDLTFPLSRKIIANKSSHSISISLGEQTEILKPNECVVGLFTVNGCYKLLTHHLISQDGGLQMRLVCGNKCANLEIHKTANVSVVENVKSIIMEAGNVVVYLKEDGDMICSSDCFELQSKYKIFLNHYHKSDLIAIERNQGHIIFYTKNNNPF